MIYLFNHKEEYIGTLLRKEVFTAEQTEELNGTIKFDLTIPAAVSEKMEGAEYVVHKDVVDPSTVQMYRLTNDKPEGNALHYTGVHVFFDEMNGYGYIRDRRLNPTTALGALSVALEGSRWKVRRTASTEQASLYFYDNTRKECIKKILDTFDVELGFHLTLAGNKITGRFVDLYAKRGIDTGKRYRHGINALSVEKEINRSDIYTAVIGRGRGEEKFDQTGQATGGFGRKINFKDVTWRTSQGDPVNKPKGEEIVEIPEFTEKFGYPDGTPRIKILDFPDISDPEELLEASYEALVKNGRPKTHYSAKISEIGKLELGDTVGIIRKDLGIYYKTRVFKAVRDVKQKVTSKVELGDNIKIGAFHSQKQLTDQVEKVKSDINNVVDNMRTMIVDSMIDDDAYKYKLIRGNKYGLAPGTYTFNEPIDQNPTKAVFIGGGTILIANSKDTNGNWEWRTALNGDGIVADIITAGSLNASLLKTGVIDADLIKAGTLNAALIKAGILSDKKGDVTFNMETGAFNINNALVYYPKTGQLHFNGGRDTSGNFRIKGSLYADKISVKNLDADNLVTGKIGKGGVIDFETGSATFAGSPRSRSAYIQGSVTSFDGDDRGFKIGYLGDGRARLTVNGPIDSNQSLSGGGYVEHTIDSSGLVLNKGHSDRLAIKAWKNGNPRFESNRTIELPTVDIRKLYINGEPITLAPPTEEGKKGGMYWG